MVAAWGDAELASSANDALRKIEAVLTPALRDRIDAVRLYVPGYGLQNQAATREVLERLRGAIEGFRIIQVGYCDEKAQVTERRLRPVALLFWGNRWTLVAWCELRVDFRSFRVDRFQTLLVLEERFTPGPGQRYEDYLAQVKATERQTEQVERGPKSPLDVGLGEG
jgi:predicted DNA-binding transcriptional regulator YafY